MAPCAAVSLDGLLPKLGTSPCLKQKRPSRRPSPKHSCGMLSYDELVICSLQRNWVRSLDYPQRWLPVPPRESPSSCCILHHARNTFAVIYFEHDRLTAQACIRGAVGFIDRNSFFSTDESAIWFLSVVFIISASSQYVMR